MGSSISSYNLRAVQTTPAKRGLSQASAAGRGAPAGRKKKEYSTLSKGQRWALAGAALAFVGIAIFLPPMGSTEEDEVKFAPPARPAAPAAETAASGSPAVAAAGASGEAAALPPPPERLSSTEFAKTVSPATETLIQRPRLDDTLPLSMQSPEELNAGLGPLGKALDRGSPEDRAEAERRWENMKSNVIANLPYLIREHQTSSMRHIALLARQNMNPAVTEAILARLNATDKMVVGRGELFEALGASSDPAVRKFLLKTASEGSARDRGYAWQAIGLSASPAELEQALKAVMDGEAQADGWYQMLKLAAANQATAEQLAPLLDRALTSAKPHQRAVLVELVADLPTPLAASRLNGFTMDQDARIRMNALRGLGGDLSSQGTLLNALLNDTSVDVRRAALMALARQPSLSKETSAHIIALLRDDDLRHQAKQALVRTNNGMDLGWRDSVWREWNDKRE